MINGNGIYLLPFIYYSGGGSNGIIMVFTRFFSNNSSNSLRRTDLCIKQKGSMIMFLSFLAAVSTKVAVEMILSGAAASVTLLTVGSRVKRKK